MSAQDLPLELRRALSTVARVPRLLVASDYDGTLAPIVSDPAKAYPHGESVRALRALAGLSGTTAAVISGRALRDLAALSRLPVLEANPILRVSRRLSGLHPLHL